MTPVSQPSPALSERASRELSQISPKGMSAAVTIGLAMTAILGIAAGVIPKKEKTYRKVAIGGSVLSLAATGLLLTLGD